MCALEEIIGRDLENWYLSFDYSVLFFLFFPQKRNDREKGGSRRCIIFDDNLFSCFVFLEEAFFVKLFFTRYLFVG